MIEPFIALIGMLLMFGVLLWVIVFNLRSAWLTMPRWAFWTHFLLMSGFLAVLAHAGAYYDSHGTPPRWLGQLTIAYAGWVWLILGTALDTVLFRREWRA